MVSLTWTNGQSVNVDADDTIRVRKTYRDYDGPLGNSRVYWPDPDLFAELAEDVVNLVNSAASKSLSELTMPGGSPVWFKGSGATGPIYVIPSNRGEGCNSSFEIGGKIQYVRETPEVVAEVIRAAGGVVKPIRLDTNMELVIDGTGVSVEEIPVWDAELLVDREKPVPSDNPFGISPNAGFLDATPGGTNGPRGPS